MSEQTQVYKPAVDVFETEKAITVLADLPGVKTKDLEIDLRENVLTLTARGPRTFVRQFTLSKGIDQSKIEAKLTDGVLRLQLPKVGRESPRTITVKAG